ncbi:MAG: GNAT family N-acetyltransferase [Bryobacteraceae bacterium]|nr:GNAT family N-acetyltransferase [Bryobacteraceae bacterium]
MSLEIRPLSSQTELTEAVRLQKEIWGYHDIDLLPVRLFVVATKIGGQVFGTFDGHRMVAFLLAVPGVKPGGRSYLHSHMMGVLPQYRDRGIGRMLKQKQREEAQSQGIDLLEWTFDPLELKNAFFNIERLGAVVRRYVLNQYGTTSSHLHGGLPTDRCVAEWHITRPRPEVAITAEIEIPNAIGDLHRSDPARAREIQKRASESFVELFYSGLTVVRFERRAESGVYLLGQWDSD